MLRALILVAVLGVAACQQAAPAPPADCPFVTPTTPVPQQPAKP